jgi:hypothetical protein
MMNVLQLQERLKDYSQQQLAQEMKMPSGQVPQYLVLGEMQRRKRMQAEQAAAQSQQSQTTVAEDAVAAAGVPQEGIAGMAQAMAPRTDMAQNTGQASMPQAPMPQAPAPALRMAGGGAVKHMQTGKLLTGISPQASTFAPSGRGTKVDGLDVILRPDGSVVDARTGQPVSSAISQQAREKLRPPSGEEIFDATTPTLSQVSSGDISMNEAQLLDEEMRQAALEGGVNPSYDYSQMMQDLYGIGISGRRLPDPDERDRGEISPRSDPDVSRQPSTLASVGVDKLASADTRQASSGLPRPGFYLGDDVTVTGFGNQSVEELQAIIDDPDASPGEKEAARTRLGAAKGVQSVLQSTGDFIAGAPDNPVIRPTLDMFSNAAASMYKAGNVPIDLAGRAVSLFSPTAGASILDISEENKATAEAMATAFDSEEVPRTTADEDVEAPPSTPEELEEIVELGPNNPTTPPSGPVTLTEPGGTGGGTGGGVSAAALSDAERGFNQDKWLALAKFGFTLMSSTLPVGMALGQAGSAGVEALQAARKTYEDAKLAQQTLAARRSGRSGRGGPKVKDLIDYRDSLVTQRESMLGLGDKLSDEQLTALGKIDDLIADIDRQLSGSGIAPTPNRGAVDLSSVSTS